MPKKVPGVEATRAGRKRKRKRIYGETSEKGSSRLFGHLALVDAFIFIRRGEEEEEEKKGDASKRR